MWEHFTMESYHGGNYFILWLDHCKVNTRITLYLLKSIPPILGPLGQCIGLTEVNEAAYLWRSAIVGLNAASLPAQLSSYRFQWLHIIALRSSVFATHIICQSRIDLHKTHTVIFRLSSSCRLQEVQHRGYIPGKQNVFFAYVLLIDWLIDFPNFYCVCSLWVSFVTPLGALTFDLWAERASCRQMARSRKRGLCYHRICLYKQQSYCRKLPHSLELSQQWLDFHIVKTVWLTPCYPWWSTKSLAVLMNCHYCLSFIVYSQAAIIPILQMWLYRCNDCLAGYTCPSIKC